MEEGGVKDPRPGVEAEWIHAFTKKSRLVLIINSYGREVEMFRKEQWVESFRHAQNRSRGVFTDHLRMPP